MSEFVNTIELLGDEAVMDSIIECTITEFRDNMLTEIGNYAFSGCTALTDVELPNAVTLGNYSFASCTALERINIPKVTSLPGRAFQHCTALAEFDFSNVTVLSTAAFQGSGLTRAVIPLVEYLSTDLFRECKNLTYVDLHKAVQLGASVFLSATSMKTLIVRTDTVCSLGLYCTNSNMCAYVPRALVEDYKAATNWSVIADRIYALEDYTVDGTIMGEFDETKI